MKMPRIARNLERFVIWLGCCNVLLCWTGATATGSTTLSSSSSNSVEQYLTKDNQQHLQKIFIDALKSDDLQAIYYATLNVEPAPGSNERNALCQRLSSLHKRITSAHVYEKDFYLIGASKHLKCTEKLPEALISNIYRAVKGDLATTAELYYRVATHKYLGVQIDEATQKTLARNLQDLLKKDDTISSLGYAFKVAPELGGAASFVAERIEDAIVQADEVDGRLLQFEGGLSVTSLVVNGALTVAKVYNKNSYIDAERAQKFANYFLSRRSVQTAKGAHFLIEALKTLSKAPAKTAPICIRIHEGSSQLPIDKTQLNVIVVDLLGNPLKTLEANQITAKISSKKDTGKVVLVEKQQFVAKSKTDPGVFVADLSKHKLTRDLYVMDVMVKTGEMSYTQRLHFKVLGQVHVDYLELGVGESETGNSAIKKIPLDAYPKKLTGKLSIDHTQKLLMKTLLVEKSQVSGTKVPISVHQVFVRFYNKDNNHEVIYVAEQDSKDKAYKFDLDVGGRGNDFKHYSGLYQMQLLVGDASLSNSFHWHLADVEFKFSSRGKVDSKSASKGGGLLPEIVHQFREPERRPARLVSDIFTGLCLTPLVLLFIFWYKLGINMDNFELNLSGIGFHLGFGSILLLFTVFWLRLNMFQTLRYLIPLAIITFLCGNSLLRRLYAQRMMKMLHTSATIGTLAS